MKQLFLLSTLMIIATATFGQAAASDFPKLHWLTGTWKKTNNKPGRSGSEQWEHSTPAALKGIGIRLQGKDTTFTEKLALLVKDDSIYYVADVPENKAPIYFKVTAIHPNGFTCENPQHDFPKKIVYEIAGKHLKVTTSGDGKTALFLFEKE
ncbi:DUF6265 family protein [Chitinophaga nivalis]|uniref:DUF6265 family protein n=1 Tax=Chitinophaga nivalis TaxID=2991709 RepID=A0ABT3IMF2_9BACT|nr:DUF6265 family protein [Chitinophaga nivalis]MCW3465176.1 DUF6265 family protein [Chitinophaga nivalis]MCW3485132.1 DUF6265 family protein [Chitinophaga nivalis]